MATTTKPVPTTPSHAADSSRAKKPAKQFSWSAFFAGGSAGVITDVALFPLDTIKTRMQAEEGFLKAGGFRGVFKGLGAGALGSFPGAAAFFVTYDAAKTKLASSEALEGRPAVQHLTAASLGEIMACLIRVPTDNIKQNLQTNRYKNTMEAVREVGRKGGFYNGYLTTLMRDIPFSMIQFPLWEFGKSTIADFKGVQQCNAFDSAAIGSVAGAIGAACTCPIDVTKTRMMTSPEKYPHMISSITRIMQEEGYAALFRGIQPRVFWISCGGFVFFGAYEKCKSVFDGLAGVP